MASKKPLPAADAPTADYRVLSVVIHDGERYEVGETITLTQAAHDALPVGVVAAIDASVD